MPRHRTVGRGRSRGVRRRLVKMPGLKQRIEKIRCIECGKTCDFPIIRPCRVLTELAKTIAEIEELAVFNRMAERVKERVLKALDSEEGKNPNRRTG